MKLKLKKNLQKEAIDKHIYYIEYVRDEVPSLKDKTEKLLDELKKL